MSEDAPKTSGTAEEGMLPTRISFAPLMKGVIKGVLILISVVIVGTLLLIFCQKGTTETALYVRLMQITLGMILGATCVFLGVLVSWLGIQEGFKFSGQGATAQMQLAGTGPGIALIVGGVILVAASLYKEVRYQETVEPDRTVIERVRPEDH